jgi:serine protease Do
MKEEAMNRRFTLISLALTATLAFFLGLLAAGPLTPSPVASASAVQAPRPAGAPRPAPPATTMVNFADVVGRVNAAVVNIDATSRGRRRLPAWHPPIDPFGGPPDRGAPRDQQRDPPRRGAGSGFIIDASGLILTNNHVVEGAERLTVKLADGRSLHARIVGTDPDIDIALIKVDSPLPLPVAPLGDSSTLRAGEWVCAIGNPLAYEHSVTVGVVSYVRRKLWDPALDEYIQTDAAINFGNSGGPLINAKGEVIGINAAISSRASSIGFAVPINQATAVLPQLKTRGRVSRGYMGIRLREMDPDLERSLRLGHVEGALVEDVTPGSPGERAGIRVYDLIQGIDDQKVQMDDDLISRVSARQPGTVIRLRVLRDGLVRTIAVKLAERPARPGNEDAVPSSQREPAPARPVPIGLTVKDLDKETIARLGIPKRISGVLITQVELLSPAYDAEIERSSVVVEINRQPVASVADYGRITGAARPGDALTLYLYVPSTGRHELHTIQVEGQ